MRSGFSNEELIEQKLAVLEVKEATVYSSVHGRMLPRTKQMATVVCMVGWMLPRAKQRRTRATFYTVQYYYYSSK